MANTSINNNIPASNVTLSGGGNVDSAVSSMQSSITTLEGYAKWITKICTATITTAGSVRVDLGSFPLDCGTVFCNYRIDGTVYGGIFELHSYYNLTLESIHAHNLGFTITVHGTTNTANVLIEGDTTALAVNKLVIVKCTYLDINSYYP